jgi:hypothetical protein
MSMFWNRIASSWLYPESSLKTNSVFEKRYPFCLFHPIIHVRYPLLYWHQHWCKTGSTETYARHQSLCRHNGHQTNLIQKQFHSKLECTYCCGCFNKLVSKECRTERFFRTFIQPIQKVENNLKNISFHLKVGGRVDIQKICHGRGG